jgi:hypothetical protein
MRMVALIQNEYHTDISYTSNAISYWSTIEPNTGIVCACVMTLKPLITRFVPSLADNNRLPGDAWNEPRDRRRPDDQNSPPLTIGSRPIRKTPGSRLRESFAILTRHDRLDSVRSPSERAILESRGTTTADADAESLHLADLEAALTREEREAKMNFTWDDIREQGKEPSIQWPFRPPKARLRAANLRRQSNDSRKRDTVSSQNAERKERAEQLRSFYIP